MQYMNSKTRLLVLLIMCWLVLSVLQAQDCITAFNRDVIEAAPQSVQLRRYDSPQPDLATGEVNVSIPLFDIEYRGLTIPFELNYSTSGMKVFDVSFPYGLGWTLMPGLRIYMDSLLRPALFHENFIAPVIRTINPSFRTIIKINKRVRERK